MRCQDCNCNLTDEESTRKNEQTGEYWDLCNKCLDAFYRDTNFDLLVLDEDDESYITNESGWEADGS